MGCVSIHLFNVPEDLKIRGFKFPFQETELKNARTVTLQTFANKLTCLVLVSSFSVYDIAPY